MPEKNEIDDLDLDEDLFGDDSDFDDGSDTIEMTIDPSSTIAAQQISARSNLAEKVAQELEQLEIQKDYKYLQLTIYQRGENEFIVQVRHQSHGFLNYMVTKILNVKGVLYAAYKIRDFNPPKIYIRTDGSKEIKAILAETTKKMEIELKGFTQSIKQGINF